MSEECGNCRFWRKRSDHAADFGGGYCVRFPPFWPGMLRIWPQGLLHEIEPVSTHLNDAWPMVHQQSWCGEYIPARIEAREIGERDE